MAKKEKKESKARFVNEGDSRSSGGRIERDVGNRGGFVFGRGRVTPGPTPREKPNIEVGGGIGIRFGGPRKKRPK
jgi:hypothetical protein